MVMRRMGFRLMRFFLFFFGAGILCFLLQEFYLAVLIAPFHGLWEKIGTDFDTALALIGNIVGFLVHAGFMVHYAKSVALDDIRERKYRPQLFNGEYSFSWIFTFAPLAFSLLVNTELKFIFVFFYAPFLTLRELFLNEYFFAAIPFFTLEAVLVIAAYSFFGKRYIRQFEQEHGMCVYYEE